MYDQKFIKKTVKIIKKMFITIGILVGIIVIGGLLFVNLSP